jgi:type 1 glutamine amidotransferase
MGEKTGAFKADLSRDGAELTPEKLAGYDAIIINNPTGDFLTTPSLRQGLLDFVSSGKGVVGIHAASDANFAWEEYGELIGGFFVNHPWNADTTVTLKIEQPEHPVNQGFNGGSFEVKDEIYQFREPYSRDKLLVLVSLDTEKTDMEKKGIQRTDNDFAVSWVQPWGKGRVFYSSLGHNPDIFWNETVLQHYLDGIQFALGDLKAPVSASDSRNTATAETPGK